MNSLLLKANVVILLGSASLAAAQDKVNFEKDIYPFLAKSCVGCHKAPYQENGRTKKPKGDLRLDSAWGIVKGSKDNAVVEPGKPDKSPLLQRTMLADDHDDIMPPSNAKERTPLTQAQKDLLKKWIEQGADFGGWKGESKDKPADAKEAFEKK